MNQYLQRARKYLANHPGTFITLVAVSTSIIGVCYHWVALDQAGINSLYYITAGDFLLFFIRGLPFLLVFWLLNFLHVIFSFWRAQKLISGDSVKERKLQLWQTIWRVEFIAFIPLSLLFAYASGVAKYSLFKISPSNCVLVNGDSTNPHYLYESSSDWLFMFSGQTNELRVLSKSSITSLDVCESANKSLKADAVNGAA